MKLLLILLLLFNSIGHIVNDVENEIMCEVVSFNVVKPVCPFIGRVLEMSELKWMQIDKKMTLITGDRGVGKTELAKHYANTLLCDKLSNVIWIDASSNEKLIHSFKQLSKSLGIQIKQLTVPAIILKCFQYFDNQPTLFVFDNAKQDNILINNIPNFICNINKVHVIVTSRDEKFNKAFTIIRLSPFNEEELLEYLNENLMPYIKSNIKHCDICAMLKTIGTKPGDLNIAVKTIKSNMVANPKLSFDEFITNLKQNFGSPITSARIPISDNEIEDYLLSQIRNEKCIGSL